jgi:hypothetical protein
MSAVRYFAIRDDQEIGTGTADDPFNGSTDLLLDTILANSNLVTTDMTLIFGPGVFRTKGWSMTAPYWTVKSRQRLIGSGMHSTIFQLVKVRPPKENDPDPNKNDPAAKVYVIGSGVVPVDGVEISDMTIDVNLARQPKPPEGGNPLVVGAGLMIKGSRLTIRRVRVVGWGTYTRYNENSEKTGECFPIFIEGVLDQGVEPGLNVVEDCIVEHPAIGQARETTMLNAHTYFANLGVFSTVRNNYINGDRVAGTPELPVSVSRIGYKNGIVTVKTTYPHRLSDGPPPDDVLIQGAGSAEYNNRFTVNTVPSETVFTIKVDGLGNPPPTAGMIVRRYVPGPMRVKTISNVGTTVTVETYEPHYRKPNDYIRISGVRTSPEGDNNFFNGSFKVASVTSDYLKLTYIADSVPGGIDPNAHNIWLDRWPSQMVMIAPPLTWQQADGNGLVTVSTRNAHYLAPGNYVLVDRMGADDRWNGYFEVVKINNSRQFVIRMRGTTKPADAQNNNAYSTAQLPQLLQALAVTAGYGGRVWGNRVNDVYTGGPYHDLGPNPPVNCLEKDCSTWNNYYYFVYVGPFCNVADRLSTAAPNFDDRQLWNVTHDNIVDLQPWPAGGWNEAPPAGVGYWGRYAPTNFLYAAIDTVIARDNIIRFVDNNQGPLPQNGYIQYGMDFCSVRNLILDDNLVTMRMKDQTPALSKDGVEHTYQRNNRSMDGAELTLGTRDHSLMP